MKKNFNFSVVNLGCSKNLVDLEFVIGNIFASDIDVEKNFFLNPEDKEVKYIIINTCSFLSSSRDEAEKTIKYFDDIGKKVIVIGCYVELKNDEFLLSLRNLEAVIPFEKTKNTKNIFNSQINTLKKEKLKKYLQTIKGNDKNKKAFIFDTKTTRAYLNASYSYEYLKISEGCDNNCSFCIIPNIRGKQKSRCVEDILSEVKIMINSQVKEIQIIAQDLTRYGIDLYGESKLIELLQEIDKISHDFKYRLYYIYPDILTLEHLEKLKNLKKLIPYFDIPFQHISPKILKLMGRFYKEDDIYKMLDFIKNNFKNAFIHTNFIIGFPGENEDDFEKLKEFIKKYEFDSVSIFGYHDEKLASSSKLPQKNDDKIIILRVKKLQKILNKIYEKKENLRIGKKEIGYIHEINSNNLIIRPEIKAPEIDKYDKVNKKQIIFGNIGIGKKVEYIF